MMKNLKTLLLFPFLCLLLLNGKAEDQHVRFAFMGNSITIGTFLANPSVECYPSQVQSLLNNKYGDTCIVQNFAVSGRTMLKKGDFPLWNELQFQQSYNYAPDIVFIMLGTNDTKPYNWDANRGDFIADYQSMIDTFKVRNPRCKFILAYPPPAFAVNYDIRDSVIYNGVLPAIDSILSMNEAESVDFYHALLDSAYLFPDAIHPNAAGAKVMAKMVFDKIVASDIVHQIEPGFTYVTGIKSSSNLIAQNSDVTISWTSRNADSVYLNDEQVGLEGSSVFTVASNSIYTVRAVGSKSIDVMEFVQETYVPELSKLKSERSPLKIEVGDSSLVTITFVDQYNKNIVGQQFDLQWEFTEGEGTLVNKTANTITLIGTVAGNVRLKASIGDISVEARINVVNKTDIDQNAQAEITVFPNPTNHRIYIRGYSDEIVNYSLININGQKVQQGQIIQNQIELTGFEKGFYYLNMNFNNSQIVRKILIY